MINILIDNQYSANLGMRKPKTGLISTADAGVDGGDYEPLDCAQHTPLQNAIASEILSRLNMSLEEDERDIVSHLCDGHPAEDIARKMGINISRIRYLIYSRIQPSVREIAY